MNVPKFSDLSGGAKFAKFAGNAAMNFRHWIDLAGFRPVSGTWQPRRYHLRFKSALWAAMISVSVFAISQAQSWSPRLDPVSECYAENKSGRSFKVIIDDVSSPPDGVICDERRPLNFSVYLAFLLLGTASWTILGYLIADPSRPGVLLYRPHDEAHRITVRYALTINWPEFARFDQGDVAGMPAEEVERWLIDHMSEQLDVVIEPFAEDVAFLTGESLPKPQGLRAKCKVACTNWWGWCIGTSTSFCEVNPDPEMEG